MTYINTALSLPEIFERVALLPTIEDKVNMLRRFDRKDLRWVVDFMYNANTSKFYIPAFEPQDFIQGMSYMSILNALTKIEAALNNIDRPEIYERNLIVVMESLHIDEAILLSDILTGKKIEGISKQVFKKLYPDFFRESDNESTE